MNDRIDSNLLRRNFSQAMAEMYRMEVPQYGVLVDIVRQINADVAGQRHFRADLDSLTEERHGAIRLGKASELFTMRRFFAILGMHPVGYYDLAPAGVPVHSTAFRPIDKQALEISPFRMFCSLLRLDLIEDADLRSKAAEILDRRDIFSQDLLALIDKAEKDGGLNSADGVQLVSLGKELFRWHPTATVDQETYEGLRAQHPLIADVVCFRGPHINHLTPRVLDIDAAQAEMPLRGIEPKEVIEGPPKRACPILLRQTSFKAIAEPILFPGANRGSDGAHKARFGEIEERGCALTPKGRALYDKCLAALQAEAGRPHAFAEFPDDWDSLRQLGLAFFHYFLPEGTELAPGMNLEEAIRLEIVGAEPITYEDFLPVSAAGIFQSNLGDEARGSAYGDSGAQAEFEANLGAAVQDPFELYAAEEAASLRALGLAS